MRLNLIFVLTALFLPGDLFSQEAKKAPVTPFSPQKAFLALKDYAQASPEQKKELHQQVARAFGQKNLAHGRAAPKIEGATVLWATLDPKPAQVVREDGVPLGEMIALGSDGLQALALELPNFTELRYRIESDGMPRMAGSVRIEHFPPAAENVALPDVPKGSLQKFEWAQSQVFPGTVRDVTVYLPAGFQPDEETCLMVWQDGSRNADPTSGMRVPIVFDNLIHRQEMPRTVGVFIDPGRKPNQKPGSKAANRGFEYDSLGDAYVRFLLTEILPEVEKRYRVRFRPAPEARAIAGGSSGGICAFTAAWERPDQFQKVLSWVGSFVNLRGGHVYPSIIRITERKPLRIYLQDGHNDLDNPFGNWPLANKQMAAALQFMKYDHRIDWNGSFHGSKGMAPLLPDALRWLWRDVR